MQVTRLETVVIKISMDEDEARAVKQALIFLRNKADLREGLVTFLAEAQERADFIATVLMDLEARLTDRV